MKNYEYFWVKLHHLTRWMKKTGYDRHEVVSAKLDFILDVIEVQIR